MHKIHEHDQVKWHHVPTEDNPADRGSRGGNSVDSHLWKQGPTWLSDPSNWPPYIILETTAETMAEAKVNQKIFSVAIPKHDALDQALLRVLRIGAWVWRFIHNCRNQARNRTTGPISTEGIQHLEHGASQGLKNQLTGDPVFLALVFNAGLFTLYMEVSGPPWRRYPRKTGYPDYDASSRS